MSNNKKRHNRTRKKQKQRQEIKPNNFSFELHPLSSLPRKTVINGLVDFAKSSNEEFPKQLNAVESILRTADPLLQISILSTYGLYGTASDKGIVSTGYNGDEFSQSHVELFQALCLRTQVDEQSLEPPSPELIQQLFDQLPELSDRYHSRRLALLEEERNKEAVAIGLIQEDLRLHTQAVRNWGNFKQVVEITKRLCGPIDGVFRESFGVCATDIIDLFVHLVRRNERLLSARVQKLAPLFQENSVAKLVNSYYKANPQIQDSPKKMLAFAEEQKIPIAGMQSILLSHSDLSLPKIYTVDPASLAEETSIDAECISLALDRLSIGFGELAENDPEHFFLANPVWTRPIIKLPTGQYFCAIPQVFFSFVFPILSELLKGDASATKCYQERRADFLESDIQDLFSKGFPGCEISAGYQWKEGTTEYENDLMIRVDSHLILVEAKSHSISWSALRGAPGRARRHVRDLLFNPSVQSLRLKDRITQAISDEDNREALLPTFPVSLNHVRTVLRVSVTIEDFASLQTNIHHTKKANWIPDSHPIAPCFSLADLETTFDILELTPHKIHYLKRRADLEDHFSYKGDELDLLGFYLETGFNIGEAEFSGDHFFLTGSSEPIDKYYSNLDIGVSGTKPQPKMTRWWKDICTKIEGRGIHQWSDVANVLLSTSLSEQKMLSKKFKSITKIVQKNWRKKDHKCSINLIPIEKKKDALSIYAFKNENKENRYINMENIASNIFGSSHVERCLMIGINIDTDDYPYSLITVYFR